MAELTPMMKQYMQIKQQYDDCILMYRLGDFYEMFFEDALTASKELSLFLTGRDCGQEKRAPMCGVPFHSANTYIARLVEKGYKVAICEQLTEPGKGIVERGVVRVVTPGTVIDDDMLKTDDNNYILCCVMSDTLGGYAYADVSTGEFVTGEFVAIGGLIAGITPREVLVNETALKALKTLKNFNRQEILVQTIKEKDLNKQSCEQLLMDQFGCVPKGELCVLSSGALLQYLHATQLNALHHLNKLTQRFEKNTMVLDSNTRRNLELIQSNRENEKKGSLYWLLNKTKTPMGGRALKQWILNPLYDIDGITKRQGAIAELMFRLTLMESVGESLSGIMDLERLASKLSYLSFHAKNCISLKNSLSKLPPLKDILSCCDSPLLRELAASMDVLSDIAATIESAILDEPNDSIKDGGIIKAGYSEKVDELREIAEKGKQWLTQLEETERQETGIKGLKVAYNRVFGYYIEVTKSYMDKVPYRYIRKQTLANSERFVTEELTAMADKILNAQERLAKEEYECFIQVRNQIEGAVVRLQNTATCVATVDVLYSLAKVASENNYVLPKMNLKGEINIKEGKHPVLYKLQDNFVQNDTHLNMQEDTVMVITGPNMAGKSTYMRQVALLVLMAHMGCALPVASADICLTDRIFTRVGASDDLSTGQSTFMVEMNEVADIIENATKDSLLILDEIGRGTSTYDGLSIAWAVLEHLSDKSILGAKALFSTHYHELTELENTLCGVKNYQVTVNRSEGEIVFLYKIVPGGAMDSFGIEVARLSGLPDKIINRAQHLLDILMQNDVQKQKP